VCTHVKNVAVGWTSSQSQAGYHQTYDPYANMNMQQREDIGMKAKLINLIGAVRTLMRGMSTVHGSEATT
jgi:hypothetical protein